MLIETESHYVAQSGLRLSVILMPLRPRGVILLANLPILKTQSSFDLDIRIKGVLESGPKEAIYLQGSVPTYCTCSFKYHCSIAHHRPCHLHQEHQITCGFLQVVSWSSRWGPGALQGIFGAFLAVCSSKARTASPFQLCHCLVPSDESGPEVHPIPEDREDGVPL